MEPDVSYKAEHERFVSDNPGSSVLEIALVCATCPLSVFVREALLSWIYGANCIPRRVLFLVDYLTVILPGVLCATLFSDHLESLLVTLFSLGFLLYVIAEKAQRETAASDNIKPTESSQQQLLDVPVNQHRPFITHFRAFTSLATSCFILAVDFPVFPRRFCKTETYGTGLMDVGVGGFILANGLVSPEARGKFSVKSGLLGKLQQLLTTVKSTTPLWILGIGRLLAIKGTDYHEHVTEYGVHWNFFFTLAVVKILSTIVMFLCPAKLSWILATASILLYQYLLETTGLKEFILFGSDGLGSRDGFLNANREGIVSCLGYLAIYLVAVSIGSFLSQRRERLSEWLRAFILLVMVDALCWLLLGYVDLNVESVSRRMANLAFVIWMLAHQLFFLCSFFLVDIVATVLRHLGMLHRPELSRESPCVLEAINRNGLFYFLLANVLTGAVNLSVQTIHASSAVAFGTLLAYSGVLAACVLWLHAQNITLKFW